MEVMRKFIIELKPDGTMSWAEVCEEPKPEVQAYKKIIDHCETMMYLWKGNTDKYEAYRYVITLCKRLGNLW